MRNLSRATFVLFAGAALGAVPAAEAQFVFNALRNLRDPDTLVKFSLSPPGARSLALGGAFLALADDATAAYTNPAGLTNLTVGGSEVTLELRGNEFRNSFVDRGHYSTRPEIEPFITRRGLDFEGPGILREEAKSKTSGLSFLSFAYVLPRGLTLAAYRHELGNFATAFQTQGPFNDDLPGVCPRDGIPNGMCRFRITPRRTSTELEIVNFGLSGAIAFGPLSLGAGVSYYELDLQVRDELFDLDRFGILNTDDPDTELDDREPGSFYGPPDYTHDNLLFDTAERGDDDAIGINLGFLWKLGRQQRWSLGGVYRQGPDFATARTIVICDVDDDDVLSCLGGEASTELFTVPDVIGLGLAFRTAQGKTKILLDLNRVRYSERLVDFFESSERFIGLDPADFRIEDADQLHLGVERTVLVVESLFVGTARFGAWREPFHELEYLGTNEDLAAVIDRPEDTEIHYSAGFGLVIKEDYQIDFAADLSDPNNTYSFSLVKFF
jgi:long-chain fatty acid transport protein